MISKVLAKNKICPTIPDAFCEGEDCMWWHSFNDKFGECCLMTIAMSLKEIVGYEKKKGEVRYSILTD